MPVLTVNFSNLPWQAKVYGAKFQLRQKMIDNPLIEIEGYVVYVYGERKKKTLNISFFVHHLHKFIHNTMLEAKK